MCHAQRCPIPLILRETVSPWFYADSRGGTVFVYGIRLPPVVAVKRLEIKMVVQLLDQNIRQRLSNGIRKRPENRSQWQVTDSWLPR